MAQATLTVWKFGTPGGAEDASSTLKELAKQNLITIHDAAYVTWAPDKKKPKTHQLNSVVGRGALGGTFWGLLFGLIFFVPLLGAAVGAATGALAGTLTDAGIDDSFINQVRDQVTPGTSALFLMSSDAVIDKVKDELAGHDPDELIFTNLSGEQEAALRQVFAQD
ncbi:DUF1269 domain-containing protein [Brachybacterium saurashtrense]|uniref:DUF1269 domain-containing protein n=1 Tax=Brachybacterium saurashtrense TaxID=556288 RepID=A0A345YLV9_9MICO|nr:DUF1269 domain-containing protein [Brachybacterium saurashtrense]AXK44911.1 DUF1269 domain-containing protein [Brachybacterium saurashtrense]RRR21595.1 DUF1269 domain-containing protein [Brachybacterium saurashtrense]